jgi:hypothetical protein
MGHGYDHNGFGAANINGEVTPTWHFSCFSYDGTSVRSWVDGSLNWEWAVALNTDASSNNAKAYISSHNNAAKYHLSSNALIDEVGAFTPLEAPCQRRADQCVPSNSSVSMTKFSPAMVCVHISHIESNISNC